MNSIRPSIIVVSLVALLGVGLLIWDPPLPQTVPEPSPEKHAAPPPSAQDQAVALQAKEPVAETSEKQAETTTLLERVSALKYRGKSRERMRQEELAKREQALDRFAELRYSQAEGERLRDRWESAFDDAADRLRELDLTGQNVDGFLRNAEMQAAHDQLRAEFGEEDYQSARYADDLSTQLRLGKVSINSPAAKAGFFPDDTIAGAVSSGSPDAPVNFFSNSDFNRYRNSLDPSEVVTYIVLRNGKSLNIEVGNRGYLGISTYGFSEAP